MNDTTEMGVAYEKALLARPRAARAWGEAAFSAASHRVQAGVGRLVDRLDYPCNALERLLYKRATGRKV